MPTETLMQVFNKAQFSWQVSENLGNAIVTRITINQESRIMRINLSVPNGAEEDALRTLKRELCGHFPTIADVHIDVDGPIIPSLTPPISPPPVVSGASFASHQSGNGNGKRSFRKIKVNKTIPADRCLLSEELKADEAICDKWRLRKEENNNG